MNGKALVLGILLFGMGASVPSAQESGANGPKHVYLTKFAMPSYPPLGRQAGAQGTVTVTAKLSQDGKVDGVVIASDTGEKIARDFLEPSVINAVKSWQFYADGAPMPEHVQLRFVFVFEGPKFADYTPTQISGDLPWLVRIVTNPPERRSDVM